jgi:preprotein translocase subunit YajC
VLKILFGIFYFLAYRKVREASAKRRLAESLGEGATGLLDAFA